MYGLINQPAVFMTEDDLKSRSDELLYGWAVKATGEKEDFWYVTSHYGYKGYVPKAAVTPVSLEEIKAREVKLIRRPVIDVLAEPKVSAEPVKIASHLADVLAEMFFNKLDIGVLL